MFEYFLYSSVLYQFWMFGLGFFFPILFISGVLLEACQINQFTWNCLACLSWKKGTTALWGYVSISISVDVLKIEKLKYFFSQFFWGKCVVFRVYSVFKLLLRDLIYFLSYPKRRKRTGVPLWFKWCHPWKHNSQYPTVI